MTTASCAHFVEFYGPESAWDRGVVLISYTLPPNASVLFVAYENGTVIGSSLETTGSDQGYHADADRISLSEAYVGNHTLRVRAYRDANGNGQFDPGSDTACRRDGQLVETDPKTINYSSFRSTPNGRTRSS